MITTKKVAVKVDGRVAGYATVTIEISRELRDHAVSPSEVFNCLGGKRREWYCAGEVVLDPNEIQTKN